jgi:preprotein translocase subunit SecY
MKPDQMAKNLKDNGGYVPGIRPGKDTEDYFSKMLIKLTTAGSVFLAVIAAFPILLNMLTSLPSSVSIGGTSLLIVVGVSVETYKQIESSLLAREYTGTTTSTRSKRRARR